MRNERNIRNLTVFETFYLVNFIRFDIFASLDPRDAIQVPLMTYTHTCAPSLVPAKCVCVCEERVD